MGKYKNNYSDFLPAVENHIDDTNVSTKDTDHVNFAYQNKRELNQMTHYFDLNNFKFEKSEQSAKSDVITHKPVTKRDIQRFRRKKEERQKIKNRWLYE